MLLQVIRGTPYLASEPHPSIRITANIGFAIYPDDARNKKDLLLMADQAMYRVKEDKKNAVASCQQTS